MQQGDLDGQKDLAAGPSSPALKEFFDREFDIFCYLSEKYRGEIPSTVEGQGRAATIGMAELLV